MPYKHIIFDLDGTIVMSHPGIINSLKYALTKLNLKTPPDEELYSRIGPPLTDSFRDLGVPEGGEDNAIKIYREYYSEKGLFECKIYDGIPNQLKLLKNAGKTILLATSKPKAFAERILKHYDLIDYFSFIAGSNFDQTMTDKAELIRHTLKSVGGVPGRNAIIIGDRKHDINGAKQTGIASAGVLYGYGTEEELTEYGADIIVPRPEDIYPLILKAENA